MPDNDFETDMDFDDYDREVEEALNADLRTLLTDLPARPGTKR